MVYIYTEDTTSGFDFIKTIIERVIKPKKYYNIQTLHGAHNCNLFIKNLCVSTTSYKNGDILIFYFDLSTLDDAALRVAVQKLNSIGVKVYFQSFYCFESAFFSYSAFRDGTFVFGKKQQLFLDFVGCLEKQYDFIKFKEKYSKIYPNFITENATLESMVTIVFSLCTRDIRCLFVSKIKYKTLAECLSTQKREKAYYNNQCNKLNPDDLICIQHKNLSYCARMQHSGICHKKGISRGLSANLHDLYKHSVLSNSFSCIQGNYIVDSGKTLKELL